MEAERVGRLWLRPEKPEPRARVVLSQPKVGLAGQRVELGDRQPSAGATLKVAEVMAVG